MFNIHNQDDQGIRKLKELKEGKLTAFPCLRRLTTNAS